MKAPPKTRSRAKTLRRTMTEAEIILWSRLRRGLLNGYHFRRQHPVGPFIADFACTSARLVIELDGGQHAELAHAAADTRRTKTLESAGFTVVRFWNDDVLARTDQVLEEILRVARCGR